MAIINEYAQPNAVAGSELINGVADAIAGVGRRLVCVKNKYTIKNGNSAGSVIRMFRSLPSELIPVMGLVGTAGVAGVTDADIGLYDTDFGPVVDQDCFADGLTLAAAVSMRPGTALDAFKDVLLVDRMKTIAEIVGNTNATKKRAYDVGLRLNQAASADGLVVVELYFASL